MATTKQVTRAEIVREARKWLGVRWRHQGRTRAGVDCAGLICKVASALGLSDADMFGYSKRPDGQELRLFLDQHAVPLADGQEPQPGDILLLRFECFPTHLAIKTDVGMIHSYAALRRVVEHSFTEDWQRNMVAAYSFPGVSCHAA